MEGVDAGELRRVYEEAMKGVRASRLTDAELIYTPSQIALGALWMVSSELARGWMGLKGEVEVDGSESVIGETMLEKIVGEVEEMIREEGVEAEVEAVREVDRRLRTCKNPEKMVGSKAYKRMVPLLVHNSYKTHIFP